MREAVGVRWNKKVIIYCGEEGEKFPCRKRPKTIHCHVLHQIITLSVHRTFCRPSFHSVT